MKKLKLFILLFLTTTFLFSQGHITKPFLWKVTKHNQEFYLFGTMHLQVPELQILPQKLISIIKDSDEVYTEVPMDLRTQLEATKYILRHDSKNLKDILSPKLYNDVKGYLYKINPKLNINLFNKMKIWAISSTLSYLKIQLEYPNMRLIDNIIYEYAKSKQKSVYGIETIEEQLGLMDKFTQKEQIISLEETISQLNEQMDYMDELKKLYLDGDEEKIMRFIESMLFQIPKYKELENKFMNLLLYNRNLIMAQRIDKILKKSPPKKKYLFAFGVMHFLGKKSVIKYLKVYGYSIERVK